MQRAPDRIVGDERPDAVAEVGAWAAGGAMALTGRPGSAPLGPPARLVPRLTGIAERLAERSGGFGHCVVVDPVALLGERAALAGLERQGTTSCGGATRLVRAQDGWLAVSLARAEDFELVPAWLECRSTDHEGWDAIVDVVAARSAQHVVERGVLLGLPVAVLPAPPSPGYTSNPPAIGLPARGEAIPGPAPPRTLEGLVVVDLSGLWAGPLCGSLLAAAGADVIKVESTRRPDGARQGPSGFFDLLNAGKRSVALDLGDAYGRSALAALIDAADVVIEASRPRALEQLGIHASDVLAAGRVRVWASITGHGRSGAGRNRVAFGDDAAVAGGLVVWDGDGPCFCADAVADPVTGLVSAAAILDALHAGGRWLLDVPMAGVAAHLAGPTLPAGGLPAVAPRARLATGPAPALGEHTDAVLHDLGFR